MKLFYPILAVLASAIPVSAQEWPLRDADVALTTVEATAMIEAGATARREMYPASLHGLTALVYALVTLADAQTIDRVIEVMAEIRTLADGQAAFAALPLGVSQGSTMQSSFGFSTSITFPSVVKTFIFSPDDLPSPVESLAITGPMPIANIDPPTGNPCRNKLRLVFCLSFGAMY